MDIVLRSELTTGQGFRTFIQHREYEKYILELLREQRRMFPDRTYKIISEQSHGEADYEDDKGNKYDVKLLLNDRQGRHLASNDGSVAQWLRDMIREFTQLGDPSVYRENWNIVRSSTLYRTMDARINDIRDDEIGLLFLPFSVQTDIEGHPFLTFATDTLQVVYDTLIEDKGYRKRIYFIYPSAELNKIVIRDANNRENREYVQTSILAEIFEYKTHCSLCDAD